MNLAILSYALMAHANDPEFFMTQDIHDVVTGLQGIIETLQAVIVNSAAGGVEIKNALEILQSYSIDADGAFCEYE